MLSPLVRTTPRLRRPIPAILLWGLWPVVRYCSWRRAWILRGIGESFGPVLVRRGDVTSEGTAKPPRRAHNHSLDARPQERATALQPRGSRPKLAVRPRPLTRLPIRAHGHESPRLTQPRTSHVKASVATPANTARASRPKGSRPARGSAARGARPRLTQPVPVQARRRRLDPARSAVLVGVGVALAATAGSLALISTGGGSEKRSNAGSRISAGAFVLPVPRGWTRASPTAADTTGLVDSVALRTSRDASGTLIVGRAATATGLLPRKLTATFSGTPAPQLVTLGGARYYRYLDVTPRAGRGSESVYTLPTTAGTMLAVCVAHRPGSSFAARCEHVLGAARLTAGTTAASPEPSYAAAFTAVIRKLNAIRVSATQRLSNGRDAQKQASAAATLAAGHLQAAAALERLNGGTARSANASVAAAIRAIGSAYQSLGNAASRGDTTAYNAASAEISSATVSLSSAFARLRALGYQVQGTPA
jgi:hypothetical protein